MGNNSSIKDRPESSFKYQLQVNQLFDSLCDGETVSKERFFRHFKGPSTLGTKNLFDQYFIDLTNVNIATKKLFVERSHWLFETDTKSKDDQIAFYLALLSEKDKPTDEEDVKRIIFECQNFCNLSENLNKSTGQTEELDTVEDDVQPSIGENEVTLHEGALRACLSYQGDTLHEKFLLWCQQNFTSIFKGLQCWLHQKFTGIQVNNPGDVIPVPMECESSDTQLNQSLLWYLCGVLPACFTTLENRFKVNENDDCDGEEEETKKYTWNLLYNSDQHGLSLNRFKHRVMNYKSPTLTIITFRNGLQTVMGLDQAWEDSPTKFGGPYCILIEVSPILQIVEAKSNMFYLKENGRSIPTGIVVGNEPTGKLSISKDFQTAQIKYKELIDEEVDRVEVWGCGGVEAIKSQTDMKKWEQKEIEKRKKVKLPGQWDQDKTILEMGGVTVSHSQRGDV